MHTIIGYLLLMNGDASLARSGWLAMIRAEIFVSAGKLHTVQGESTVRS